MTAAEACQVGFAGARSNDPRPKAYTGLPAPAKLGSDSRRLPLSSWDVAGGCRAGPLWTDLGRSGWLPRGSSLDWPRQQL